MPPGPWQWKRLSTATTVTCLISCTAFHSPCLQCMPPRIRQSPRLQEQLWATPKQQTWQAGNVEQDFAKLEQAIAFTNADQNLEHHNRIETLNYFAQQRRPISPDIIRYAWTPLLLSFIGSVLLKAAQNRALWFGMFLRHVSRLHFWLLVVLAPLLTYGTKRLTRIPAVKTPNDSVSTAMETFRTLEEKAPVASAHNCALCLLEQWTSAIAGTAALASYCSFVGTNTPLVWLVQFASRCGVLASLHQYPKLWFSLIRSGQPRPVQLSVWMVQRLANWLYTPWFVALDVALFMSAQISIPWPSVCLFYGGNLFLTGLAAVAFRSNQHSNFIRRLGKLRGPPIRIMMQAALLGWMFKRRQSIFTVVDTIGSLSAVEYCVYFPWRLVVDNLWVGLALIGPICHIWASLRLVRVQFMHGLSLSMNMERFDEATQQLLDNETGPADAALRKWRYTLSWREPERIRVTLAKWRRVVAYWLFVSGSVEDKLRREYRHKRQSETKSRGLTVLQRVADGNSLSSSRFALNDRDSWKQNAMNRLEKMHQDDYDLGTMNDPLGIAVQQTLGIGLGFNFDHVSDLPPTERPTTRRLQARAAKSAIRRVQEIYDPDRARLELDAITDSVRRDERALELRRLAEEEVNQLAHRLAELIPTDLALERARTTPIQLFDSKSFKRTSSNEYLMSSSGDRSPTLDKLLQKQKQASSPYDVDFLNPKDESEIDDAFIKEWKRRYLDTISNMTNFESGDDDGDAETVLA